MRTTKAFWEELSGGGFSEPELKAFREALLSWWHREGIAYPWRSYRDPWRILLTEILLRKTNAEKVRRLIDPILERLKTPSAALELAEEELISLLQPFGMQRMKAKQIRRAAEIITQEGEEVLREAERCARLPGVGPYITNAVLCFAFEQPAPVVDTNVIRVLLRVFGLRSVRSRPREDPYIWKAARLLTSPDSPRQYSWALLDLGKKLCRPRRPKCVECPLAFMCWWRQRYGSTSLPVGGNSAAAEG